MGTVSYTHLIMSRLRNKDTASAYNLRFTILTAARSGESRGALWSEIDTQAKVWTIPAERMKAGREHKVPLCDEAIEILETMKKWNIKKSEIVFVGGYGKVMSDVAINKTLHAINPNVTVHGFRSTFRIWGAETTVSYTHLDVYKRQHRAASASRLVADLPACCFRSYTVLPRR